MEIILKINNEDKKFIAPFVSTRRLKETLKLSEKVQEGFTLEIMDEVAEYEVSLYGNQFTVDDLLDGYPAENFFNKVLEDMENVVGQFNESVKN